MDSRNLRLCFVSLALCLVCCTLCVAQPRCTPVKAVENLGDIAYRTPRTATFEIRNTGNKPLVITSATASCGCTEVTYTQDKIAPGHTTSIKATYDAATMGTFQKEVELTTNASAEPLYLVFRGRVTTNPRTNLADYPIDLDNVRTNTNTIEFENVRKGEHPVAEMQIVNAGTMAYQPQLMHLPPFLSATYQPETLPAGHTGTIKITLDSDQLPDVGLTQRPIYLARYLGDKVGDENEISVSAVLLPDLNQKENVLAKSAPQMSISSETVDLGSFGKKNKLSTTISISNTGTATLVINRLQAFSKALAMSCDSRIAPGHSAKLKVTVNREWLAKDKNSLRILMACNDPDKPIQTITLKVQP